MYGRNNGIYPASVSHLFFEIADVAGRWCSREGSPEVCICRGPSRRSTAYWITIAYNGEVVKRPLYTQQGIHHFELFGRIEMSYDSIQDILNLSYYGNYYRKED